VSDCEKASCVVRHWWLSCVLLCGNLNVKQATSQQVFKVTTICMDIRFQPFSPLVNRIVHHVLNKLQLMLIADWYYIMPQMQ